MATRRSRAPATLGERSARTGIGNRSSSVRLRRSGAPGAAVEGKAGDDSVCFAGVIGPRRWRAVPGRGLKGGVEPPGQRRYRRRICPISWARARPSRGASLRRLRGVAGWGWLPGEAARARAAGRAEGDRARLGCGRGLPRALPARVAADGVDRSSQRDPRVRGRRACDGRLFLVDALGRRDGPAGGALEFGTPVSGAGRSGCCGRSPRRLPRPTGVGWCTGTLSRRTS